MRIHKEATIPLIRLLFGLLTLNLAISLWLKPPALFSYSLILLSVLVFALIVWFFRNPNLPGIKNSNAIISPADGKIVAIEEIDESQYFHDKRLQVSIFMSIYDVHINYVPLSGNVIEKKYFKGKYLVARHPKSSLLNERCEIIIKTRENQKILLKQIAGAVARRVKTYVQLGNEVSQGDELGFIKFGSRVDIILPTDFELNVRLFQKVKGNSSILGFFNQSNKL